MCVLEQMGEAAMHETKNGCRKAGVDINIWRKWMAEVGPAGQI